MKRKRASSISSESTASSTKIAAIEGQPQHGLTLRCDLPPHAPREFAKPTAYEEHYNAEHTNRCETCGCNFPTAYLLDLHITEEHDPFVAMRRDAGQKTYRCFVEGCNKVCQDWKKRRNHLVDKHSFPRNYDFFIVNTGIDRRRSLLRTGIDAQGHRKSSRERGKQGKSASRSTTTSMMDETYGMPPASRSSTLECTEEVNVGAQTLPSSTDTTMKDLATDAQTLPPGADVTMTDLTTNAQTLPASADIVMKDLTTDVSGLRMVPRSKSGKVPRKIQFGHRKQFGQGRR